jgi:RNA polymerase-interacting CarD/CdnL/TRCF family regulator
MSDYQIGDKVIHATYGLGEILRLEEKFIHERKMLCYVVRIRDMTIWVNADEMGKSGLRRPTRDNDFEKLFALLKSEGDPLPEDAYQRRTALIERMKDGSLSSICTVIRDLNGYRKQKKYNDHDKSILERAKNFLLSEWMHSRSVSSEQVNTELNKLLE